MSDANKTTINVNVKIDDKEVLQALKNARFTTGDMLDIEKKIALTIINRQVLLVPTDTTDTQKSIGSHIQSATATEVIDHIGPETDYAPWIETGVPSRPNYPIQPFVRPSVFGNEGAIKKSADAAFRAKITEVFRG